MMKILLRVKMLQRLLKILPLTALILLPHAVSAAPIFRVFMQGNTYEHPFYLRNLSTANEKIESFSLDISGLGFVFDVLDDDLLNNFSTPFNALLGSGTTTGLMAGSGAADNSSLLQATFNDFDFNERLVFEIDVDGPNSPIVKGADLAGAQFSVGFSDGSFLSGFLEKAFEYQSASRLMLEGSTLAKAINSPSTLSLLALFPILLVMRRSKKRQSA